MASTKLQPPRGTHDLSGEEFRRHHHVIATARRICALYGFEEWATPIFEDARVFLRGLGETSDVVSKEMYAFTDRGGEDVVLRPEGTAGICRALVSQGLTQTLPRKVFYAGPMFRYERPQAGRTRQFHQIGAEILGAAEPLADAEAIAAGHHIQRELGIADGVVLEVNTLGDAESRDAYRAALVAHFAAHRDALSEDSQRRLEKNPLRIIDSKDAKDRVAVAAAPTIEAFLSDAARAHWDGLRRHLDGFRVPFRENPRIVRGLDYYSHTAFEFVTDRLGAQGTVMGGGRYDGLVEEMGGPPTPSVGWAGGVERLALLVGQAGNLPAQPRPIHVISVGEAEEALALTTLQALREAGLVAETAYRGNLKRRLERANKGHARAALIIGEAEAARGVAQYRDLDAGTQEEVALDALPARLAR
ncbi:MAG TPA: histidine--tRNA ligase [Roseococcus sp.]|nr:histidine--tRNA ligase [Roseococcus sp.]